MKEKPILFSGPMVRALLAGTKKQTRRVVKPEGAHHVFQFRGTTAAAGADEPTGEWGWCGSERVINDHIRCPYGKPSDRLWVRETWSPDPPCDGAWAYTAWAGCREGQIAGVPERFRHPEYCNYAADWPHEPIIWTPSIHMPRWASRLTLEITDVRVERLQDINEHDAAAEGVATWAPGALSPDSLQADPSDQFRWLWGSINGPYSWDENPWVWVVEFTRIDKPQTAH